jgi:hypothetical protein
METLEEIKDGRTFIDQRTGLIVYWQPCRSYVENPEGEILFRTESGKPFFIRVLGNENNFEGQVKIEDDEGDIVLNITEKHHVNVISWV